MKPLIKEVTKLSRKYITTDYPHILRHTWVVLLAEKEISKGLLQGFLGHQKPETTETYTHSAALDVR